MAGGAGNDVYVVDQAGDKVIEAANAGGDTVRASIDYVLGASVENLVLTGTGELRGTGNALGNTLTGNDARNVLDGKAGADSMAGGGGNDAYFVDDAGDKVIEFAGDGVDTVQASVSFKLSDNVENLKLAGPAINGIGNDLANKITGTDGANVLNGGGGKDVLIGGGGADTFVFSTALGANNIDVIDDFSVAADMIKLDDAIFDGLAKGTLSAGAFFNGTAAHDASDRIIYDGKTGALFFDADGAGGAAQIRFGTLDAGLALTQNDFVVF